MKFLILFLLVAFVTTLVPTGCKDELLVETNEFNLRFSSDTIMFDTVFTTIGTTTRRFTVHNPNNGRVRLHSVSLAKGSESNFSINVDGRKGPTVMDVEIEKKDSIYIFVEANIDPNRDEMVEKDSIVFSMGSSQGDVKVIAFGQDVNLINGQGLTSQTWNNQKPYLVYNYAVVDEDNTLTIEAGTAIHFHYGASLIINGTLNVSGTVEQPVVFRTDRLEEFYKDKPGQWGAWIETDDGSIYLLGGIHFTQKSSNNFIDHAIIENAIIGIQMDSVPGGQNPGLRVSNTIIRHMNLAGIVAKTSSIESHNLVVNNCGMYALALLLGGNYWFNHATIANYTPYTSRSTPAVVINNYYSFNGETFSFPLDRCTFTNSIIHGRYGNTQSEIGVDLTSGQTGNFFFDHCLLQTTNTFDTSDLTHFRQIKTAPEGVSFKDIGKYDFDLDTLSPAKDAGFPDYGNLAPNDIKGRSRITDLHPDLGAYEREE